VSLFAGRLERRASTAGVKFDGYDIIDELRIARARGVWSNVSVTPDNALTVPAVWRCVQLTAGLIGQLPFDRYRIGPDGSRVELDPGPLLSRPSSHLIASDWRMRAVMSAQLHGNAYGLITARDRLMYPTQIELVNPKKVQARRNKTTGRTEWKFHDNPVPEDDVWFMVGTPGPDPESMFGVGLMDYMLDTLGVGLSARKYGADWFRLGGAPTAVIRPQRDPGQDGAERLKQKVIEMIQSREPAVIPQDTLIDSWKGSTPQDAALVDVLRQNSTDVAHFFGVPPELAGGTTGTSMTYSTTEHQTIQLLTYAVMFWLKRLEDSLSLSMPAGQYAKGNESAIIRTDIKTRTEVLTTELRAGVRTQNEVRALLDLQPVDGGDTLLWPPYATSGPQSVEGTDNANPRDPIGSQPS
jgi:HK97 family phage portal protein